MTENFELHLRDRLVAFSQGRVDVGAVLDARFPFEAADLSEVTQERHLDSIRTQLSGRTDERKPSWLAVLLRRQSGQYPASKRNWTMALVASVFLLVLLALLQSPVEKRTTVAGGTALPKKGLQKPDAPKDAPVAKATERPGSTKPNPRVDRVPGSDASPSIAAKVEVGVFGAVMGDPTIRLEGGATTKAFRDAPVYASSIIETGDTDNAEIRFSDGTTVRMDFNTQIRLEKPLAPGKSTLRLDTVTLVSGRVSVVAAHLSNSEKFSIKTDVATATVIGTRFSLGVSGAGGSKTAVLKVQEGKVQFSNEHGSVIAISKTESSATRANAPTVPRRLSILGQRRVGRNLFVTWEAEPRANDEKEFSHAFVFKMGSAGLRTMPLADRGVLIVGLFPLTESPARAEGVQVGDVLTRFNGRQVMSDKDLHRWIRLHPNQQVTATIEREGKVYETRFRLNEVFPANVTLRTGLISRLGTASEPALIGDPGRAVIALNALVRRVPEAPVFNNLGMAQFMEDDMAAAIKSLKEAVRLAPKTWLYRYNLGRNLIAIGNFERGIEELEKSLDLNHESTLAAAHLATALAATGRGDEAIVVLRASIEAGSTSLLVNLADALMDRSRLQEAVDAANEAIELFPDFARTRVVLAEALSRLGRYDEAEAAARAGLALDPGSAHAWNGLGLILWDTQRWPDAEVAFRRARSINPGSPVYMSNLGGVLREQGKAEEAESAYRTAIAIHPLHPSSYFGLGNLMWESGRVDEAEQMWRTTIEIEPGHVFAIGNLANVLRRKKDPTNAEGLFRRLIELDPLYAPHYHNYSIFLSGQRRQADAEAAIRTAIELGPPDALHLCQLGTVLKRQGRLEEAERHFRRALEFDSEERTSMVNLGMLLSETNRLDEAEQLLRKAHEVYPMDVGPAVGLGILMTSLGRVEEAEKLFRRAIELDPKSPHPYLQLGTLMAVRKDFRAAESFHRKAVEVDPKSADARFNLGLTLLKAGKRLEAEAEWRMAIDLDPALASPYQSLGNALRLRGDITEAEKVLRRGIAVDPKYVGVITELAVLLANAGRLVEAEPYFKTASDLKPSAGSSQNLGTIYGYLGKPENAEAVYREGLKRWPDHGGLLNNLADNLSSRNIKLEEARDLAERAVKALPADPFVRDTLGWIHYQLGEYDLAEKRILECIEIGGARGVPGVVWVHLGAVYEKKENIEKARAAYKQAIAIEPNNKEAADALKRIGS